MQIAYFLAALRHYFSLWFHRRNIIVVSEHKVRHFHISGSIQFAVLALAVGSVCWASYSTGRFMASRHVLKEQSHAIKNLASERVETSFASLVPNNRLTTSNNKKSDHILQDATANLMFNPSTLDNIKLYARVAYLERMVNQLQEANGAIVKTVRERTSGRIAEIESMIRQTGLNVDTIKKQANRYRRTNAQGGPYIPTKMSMVPDAEEMIEAMDDLDMLLNIANSLPISPPIRNAELQSGFGHRVDPFTKHLAFHSGMDFSAADDAEVFAPLEGKVIAAGRNGAYGNAIDIQHQYGVVTRYAHLSKILVQEGQNVDKGEIIGVQGNTGRSTGPHLHYEVRYRDQPLNPKNFLRVGEYVSKE
ncbi:MAG: M23 family metallopeptidase [Rickettsiales bacterium]|nr:M23 family metallopeptidase [Rickettsiales bacterium]